MVNKQHIMIFGVLIVVLISFFTFQFLNDAATVNKLQITINDIRVTDIKMTSCGLLITVTIKNPTDRELSVASAFFNVFIAGSYIGNSSVSQFKILKNNTKEQVIPLRLLYSDLTQAVIEGIKNKNFNLYISGEAQGYVFFGLLTITVPFSISSTYS